ncbi:methyltransferase-like protein 22 [Diadema antillarum]|uniref:methyltransferase-like protein 22 n=1 Tax=Diadema antillarum TaxID=105358 RepID=UPI003A8C879F
MKPRVSSSDQVIADTATGSSFTRFQVRFPFLRRDEQHHTKGGTGDHGKHADDSGISDHDEVLPHTQSVEGDESPPRADDAFQDDDGDFVVARPTSKDEYDVITIEHAMETHLPDVGLQVWLGSILLSNFILHEHQRFSGCVALELGGGTGLASIVMATIAKLVICTDIGEDVLNRCQRNILANAHLPTTKSGDMDSDDLLVKVRELDWLSPMLTTDKLKTFHWRQEDIGCFEDVDIILAGDVIYSNPLTDAFFHKLQDLMERGKPKTCFMALEKRLNFTLEDLDVTCKEYDHFRDWLRRLAADHRYSVSQLSGDIYQYVQCPLSKYLELWEIQGSPRL